MKNIDKIISKGIHSPMVDGSPLYKRVDNVAEKEIQKTEKWIEVSNRVFTSPNNIRKLFITESRCIKQLYMPLGNIKEWREDKYNKEDNLRDIKGTTGLGLKGIYKPWVCSNLEELYFDDSIFLSDQLRNSGFNSIYEKIQRKQSGFITNEFIKDLLNFTLEDGWMDRYPRLCVVGMISKLDKILEYHDKGNNDIKSSNIRWYELDKNKELITRSGSLYSILVTKRGEGKYNSKFYLRDGIYAFDDKYLKDYIKRYVEGIKLYQDKKVRVSEERKDKLEEIILQSYRERGRMDTIILLNMTFSGCKKEEVEISLNRMTEEGRKICKELLNL